MPETTDRGGVENASLTKAKPLPNSDLTTKPMVIKTSSVSPARAPLPTVYVQPDKESKRVKTSLAAE